MNSRATKYLSSKSLEILPPVTNKKKALDSMKEYLSSQPVQIQKLKDVSKLLYETINKFIELTENYSREIEILALKIIPNYTIEGQLIQAVQGIFLFFSEELNNLITELKKVNNKPNQSESTINKFEDHKSHYFKKIKEILSNSDSVKKEIELYQEYLVNKEYNEHIKRGDINNKDNEIIDINENNNKENEIKTEKNNDKNSEGKNNQNAKNDYDIIDENEEIDILKNFNPNNETGLNNINNEKEVIIAQKLFMMNIKESNEILHNIRVFLSNEKTNMRKNIFKICDSLSEGLLKCIDNQKKNYNVQNEVIKNLTKTLQFEETDKNQLRPAPIKLKFLEIYKNHIKEKNDSSSKKKSNLTTDDLKNKTKKKINPRKSFNTLNTNFNTNLTLRNTICFNQIENIFDKEKMLEKFKSMVIKLNRDEILRIFEAIKKTNIILNESDLKLIEEETNYKIIHDILVSIVINTEKYTEKDKNILINLFEKDKKYIVYFIKILNDHRTKGNYIISEKTLKYLGNVFKFLNNLILSENDMELFKYIFILSLTYYHLIEKDNIKIYLFSYIKDHPDYQKVKFWDDYLNELIEHDLKGNKLDQKLDSFKNNLDDLNKDEKEKISNCFFSNFLTVVKAMADFRMDKKFVRDFVEKNKLKYFLPKEQIENICMIYDISINENAANYNGDILEKEEGNQSNNENKIDNINSEEKENIEKKEKKENEIQQIEEKENKDKIIEENKIEKEVKIKIVNMESSENKKENVNKNEKIEEIKNNNYINMENNIECKNDNNQMKHETI